MATRPTRPTRLVDDQARVALPLTPIVMHILLALVDRDRHGLGIAEHIEEFTAGRVSLGPGTLYGAIKRLLETGLVEDVESGPKDDSQDPRRRYYTITPVGQRALELETRRLADVLDVARVKRVIR
ncbi:MAG TPA: PadR family transcriptional regulator [Vicinamibacterales bacterium]|nr:PadR family transcriptional regulator [Vicinamibacterales bacterium]